MKSMHHLSFVKPNTLSGEETKNIYLDIVNKSIKNNINESDKNCYRCSSESKKTYDLEIEYTDRDLLIAVQDNDVTTVKRILDKSPNKINNLDDYGWSLLMIACQANSLQTAKELLNRGIDTSVRDRGGNSVHTLVPKNKHLALADLLTNNKKNEESRAEKIISRNVKQTQEIMCDICQKIFPDKSEHMSSIEHNMNATKDRKSQLNCVIPECNKGYQIMLRVGWDRKSGLGRDGLGIKYPIKTLKKLDRKGLGHKDVKNKIIDNNIANIKQNNRDIKNKRRNERMLERKFRREFY